MVNNINPKIIIFQRLVEKYKKIFQKFSKKIQKNTSKK